MYNCKELPDDKALVVLTDEDGFIWSLPYARLEGGFRTPFISIEEACLALNLSDPLLLWERDESFEL